MLFRETNNVCYENHAEQTKTVYVNNWGTYSRCSCRKHILALFCLSVQLSVLKQCSSHWTQLCKVLFLECLLTFAKTYQFWSKSNKSFRHFSWRLMSIYGILSFPVFIIEADCVLCDVQSETEEAVDGLLFKTGNSFFGLGSCLAETQSVATIKVEHDQM